MTLKILSVLVFVDSDHIAMSYNNAHFNETTKGRNYDTAKQRDCETMKGRCESTKWRCETAKVRNKESAKLRMGDAKDRERKCDMALSVHHNIHYVI